MGIAHLSSIAMDGAMFIKRGDPLFRYGPRVSSFSARPISS